MGWLEPVGGAFVWHEQDPQWVTVRKRRTVLQRKQDELAAVRLALADTSYNSDEADALLVRVQQLETAIKRMQRDRERRRRPPVGERVKVVQVTVAE